MSFHPLHPAVFSVAFVVATTPLDALEIRGYDPATHDRFLDFPDSPAINPDQLDADLDLTGIPWLSNSPGIEYSLISRQHILAATHFSGFINNNDIRFLSADGTVFSRKASIFEIIPDGGQPSDLTLITLNSPLPAATGIEPLPYLNLPSDRDYLGLTLGVTGRFSDASEKFPVIGRGEIAEIEQTSRQEDYDNAGLLTNRFMRFDYRRNGAMGSPDDAHFQQGDSGSPSYAPTNGRAALVGVHSLVENPPGPAIRNFDLFVPHYVSEIDPLIAALGYRMRPVHAPPTTLGLAPTVVTPTPRRALPLTIDFDLENTGAEITGNLEVELRFAPGEAPDTITATGWIASVADEMWTFRRATLDPAVGAKFSAHWAAAPDAETLGAEVTWRSDTVGTQALTPAFPLAPSFAAWAADLDAGDLLDDPDGDGVPNLLEYALGGDPELPVRRSAGGAPLQPVLAAASAKIRVRHPRRTDAALRGLDYQLEFSSDLGGWTPDPPAGFSASAEGHPSVGEGFEIVESVWPATSGVHFARLRVTLNE